MEEAEILLRNAMEHHGAAVYRLALCRMQSVQDAEDVYQDVFLRLLGQEASAWDGEHLRAWLLRCTVNRCHDLHRFRLRRPVLALADLPETAAEADSGAAELWDAVAHLPEKLRVPIHLYYAEGYSTEEIAGLLQARCEKLTDIPEKVDFFDALPEYPVDYYTNKKSKTNPDVSRAMLEAVIPVLEGLTEWTDEAIHDALVDLAQRLEVKNATLMWPVRIAAAGKLVTPGGAVEICRILGKDETLRRLNAGLAMLGA